MPYRDMTTHLAVVLAAGVGAAAGWLSKSRSRVVDHAHRPVNLTDSTMHALRAIVRESRDVGRTEGYAEGYVAGISRRGD